MKTLTIHPELQELLTPLTPDELAQLEANLLAEGCREALAVWQEHNTLLDGHNRYALCQKHQIAFATHDIALPDLDAAKAWMLAHQLGRRNLEPHQISELRGRKYLLEKKSGFQGNQYTENGGGQNDHKQKTAEKIATELGVSEKTIRRDAALVASIDAITTVAGPSAREITSTRAPKIRRDDVRKLGTIAKANPQTARNVLEALRTVETPKEAKRIVQEAAKEVAKIEVSQEQKAVAPVLALHQQEPNVKRGIEEIALEDNKKLYVVHNPDSKPVFNQTNEMVDWASWTWNPVTGCWHGCDYCYAREIANAERMAAAYPKQFEPTFHPARLDAPRNTPFPRMLTRPADKNVFTCSMADLFGKWVPEAWIMQVFERVTLHTEWNFLFLTKFPQRLQEICDALGGFPDNAWVGCTVDSQARVATAEKSFRNIKASVRWLSVEPMKERLTFSRLDMFDWVVIGGQTASYFNKTPAFQPEWEWVEHLWQQAREANVKIYWKENLTIRPKETPWS